MKRIIIILILFFGSIINLNADLEPHLIVSSHFLFGGVGNTESFDLVTWFVNTASPDILGRKRLISDNLSLERILPLLGLDVSPRVVDLEIPCFQNPQYWNSIAY